ncbi:thioredoxin family protein [Serratia microhaemolytica]|uniref:thioredoxin family protein n=1 Tax=Serratia microhaemolytica TaxID=2675110 RepID=UPI000FDD384C|nr:thioredoxin family protein [Serratia microhaemolytica]
MLNYPAVDQVAIKQQLERGKRLVVGLCAAWCNNCEGWKKTLNTLAANHPTDCFVWLDIDEHPDMVAEVDLDVLPVLLIQQPEQVCYLGPVTPEPGVTERLLQSSNALMHSHDPGIREFLLE